MKRHDSLDLGQKVWEYLHTELGDGSGGASTEPSKRTTSYLQAYLAGFSEDDDDPFPGVWPAVGRHFDELGRDEEKPNVFTATDLLAVSFLSVNVPPRAAWSIIEARSAALTKVLAAIPVGMAIEDQECTSSTYTSTSALQELWNLLRRDEAGRLWKMGPTTVSKVMARKRPGLVPIQDSVVMRELGAEDATYWDMWWQAMHLAIDDRLVVVEFTESLREKVPEASQLSLLRVLDIVIWMHGSYGRAMR